METFQQREMVFSSLERGTKLLNFDRICNGGEVAGFVVPAAALTSPVYTTLNGTFTGVCPELSIGSALQYMVAMATTLSFICSDRAIRDPQFAKKRQKIYAASRMKDRHDEVLLFNEGAFAMQLLSYTDVHGRQVPVAWVLWMVFQPNELSEDDRSAEAEMENQAARPVLGRNARDDDGDDVLHDGENLMFADDEALEQRGQQRPGGQKRRKARSGSRFPRITGVKFLLDAVQLVLMPMIDGRRVRVPQHVAQAARRLVMESDRMRNAFSAYLDSAGIFGTPSDMIVVNALSVTAVERLVSIAFEDLQNARFQRPISRTINGHTITAFLHHMRDAMRSVGDAQTLKVTAAIRAGTTVVLSPDKVNQNNILNSYLPGTVPMARLTDRQRAYMQQNLRDYTPDRVPRNILQQIIERVPDDRLKTNTLADFITTSASINSAELLSPSTANVKYIATLLIERRRKSLTGVRASKLHTYIDFLHDRESNTRNAVYKTMAFIQRSGDDVIPKSVRAIVRHANQMRSLGRYPIVISYPACATSAFSDVVHHMLENLHLSIGLYKGFEMIATMLICLPSVFFSPSRGDASSVLLSFVMIGLTDDGKSFKLKLFTDLAIPGTVVTIGSMSDMALTYMKSCELANTYICMEELPDQFFDPLGVKESTNIIKALMTSGTAIRHTTKEGVDAPREAHVQHLIARIQIAAATNNPVTDFSAAVLSRIIPVQMDEIQSTRPPDKVKDAIPDDHTFSRKGRSKLEDITRRMQVIGMLIGILWESAALNWDTTMFSIVYSEFQKRAKMDFDDRDRVKMLACAMMNRILVVCVQLFDLPGSPFAYRPDDDTGHHANSEDYVYFGFDLMKAYTLEPFMYLDLQSVLAGISFVASSIRGPSDNQLLALSNALFADVIPIAEQDVHSNVFTQTAPYIQSNSRRGKHRDPNYVFVTISDSEVQSWSQDTRDVDDIHQALMDTRNDQSSSSRRSFYQQNRCTEEEAWGIVARRVILTASNGVHRDARTTLLQQHSLKREFLAMTRQACDVITSDGDHVRLPRIRMQAGSQPGTFKLCVLVSEILRICRMDRIDTLTGIAAELQHEDECVYTVFGSDFKNDHPELPRTLKVKRVAQRTMKISASKISPSSVSSIVENQISRNTSVFESTDGDLQQYLDFQTIFDARTSDEMIHLKDEPLPDDVNLESLIFYQHCYATGWTRDRLEREHIPLYIVEPALFGEFYRKWKASALSGFSSSRNVVALSDGTQVAANGPPLSTIAFPHVRAFDYPDCFKGVVGGDADGDQEMNAVEPESDSDESDAYAARVANARRIRRGKEEADEDDDDEEEEDERPLGQHDTLTDMLRWLRLVFEMEIPPPLEKEYVFDESAMMPAGSGRIDVSEDTGEMLLRQLAIDDDDDADREGAVLAVLSPSGRGNPIQDESSSSSYHSESSRSSYHSEDEASDSD